MCVCVCVCVCIQGAFLVVQLVKGTARTLAVRIPWTVESVGWQRD